MSIADMSFIQRMIYIVQTYSGSLLKGAGVTMSLALICTALGCLIGFGVGIVQTIEPKKKSSPVSRILLKVIKFILSA